MTQFNSLSDQSQAEIIAFNLSRWGLVEHSTMVDDLTTWLESPDGGFGDYIVQNQLLDSSELEAALELIRLTFRKSSTTMAAETKVWLKENLETTSPKAQRFPSGPNSNRFKIVQPHRQGGLGEVFLAQDSQFGRHVALKRIKEKYASRRKLRNRFLVEAEVTGGLEHPGIVPVYGLETSENGIPHYAMKFVKGQSLADAIKEFHSSSKKDFDSLEFRKLLRRFVTVCNTIHYSHSRGIIHRDLKPDNIMLGDFDETLVVDWGIAKVKSAGEKQNASAQNEEFPLIRSKLEHTQLGSVIGTPGYMSPEQALGWNDSVGPESDVHSLGATLFEMATGSRPYHGKSPDELIQNTIAGKFNEPRELESGFPKPLNAIVVKALAKSKQDRYQSALEIADDLDAFLSDEPVSVMPQPITDRIARFCRKNKGMVSVALLAMVVVMVLSIAGTVLVDQQRQRADRARIAESKAKEEAIEAKEEAVKDKENAEQSHRQASFVLDYFIEALGHVDQYRDGGQMTMAESLDLMTQNLMQNEVLDDGSRTIIYGAISTAYLGLGENKKALEIGEQAVFFAERGYGPDNVDTLRIKGNLAVFLEQNGMLDESLALMDEVIKSMRKNGYTEYMPGLLADQASIYFELSRLSEAEEIAREVLRQYPNSMKLDTEGSVHNIIGICLQKKRKIREAQDHFRKSTEINSERFGKKHINTLVSWQNYALTAIQNKLYDEAEKVLKRTVPIAVEELGPFHNTTINSKALLYVSIAGQGRTEDGQSGLKELLESIKDKSEVAPSVRFEVASHLGREYYLTGDYGLCIDCLKPYIIELIQAGNVDSIFRTDIYKTLALALLQEERFVEAQDIATKVLNVVPKDEERLRIGRAILELVVAESQVEQNIVKPALGKAKALRAELPENSIEYIFCLSILVESDARDGFLEVAGKNIDTVLELISKFKPTAPLSLYVVEKCYERGIEIHEKLGNDSKVSKYRTAMQKMGLKE